MSKMNTEQARFNMIEQQIRPWDVLDQRVLETLAQVPRERFVPESYTSLAFADTEIPLGKDQAMMPPRVEGRMLQALDVRPSNRVLEIGTGSGYVTACLARLGGNVTSLDIFPEFTERAQAALTAQRIRNAQLLTRDAFTGPVGGRYDAIAVTGSVPVEIGLFQEQLTVGGRLFLVVGELPMMEAVLIERVGETHWRREVLFETALAPLVNAPQPDHFSF